jgi:hypothetical protein
MRFAIPLALAGMTAAAGAFAAASPISAGQGQASKPRTCIPLDQVVARRTIGANAVEFDVIGGVTYRNELASPCKGIERLGSSAAIAVTTGAETGMLCAGDRVKIFDPVEVKATGVRTYPYCQLGKFTIAGAPGAANH